MADVEARLIVKVVDQATKALGEIKKGMTGLDKLVEGHSKEITKFGLAATAAGAAVTTALGFSVAAAREQIQAEKQLNAVLESTGGAAGLTAEEVNRMAAQLDRVTAASGEAILAGQTMLLGFTNIGREVFPQASQAMLDMAARLGMDVPAAALQLGKALNDPLIGLAALTRMGVQFTEAQRLVIEEMVRAGNVAGAQGLILEEVGRKFAGAAEAANDPWIQLTKSLGDVQKEIGLALLPALNELLQAILPVVRSVVDWMRAHPELTKNITILVGIAGVLLTALGSLALTVVGVTAALGVLGLTLAAGGVLALALSGIGFLVLTVIQHWEGLKFMAGEAVDYVIEKVQALLKFLTGVKDQIAAFFELIRVKAQGVQSFAGPKLEGTSTPPVARARGGTVTEPLTLVGEEGPELVSLPRGSRVHTAEETRQMAGVSVTIGQVHVHDEADEDRLVQKLARLVQLQQQQAA